MNTLRESTPKKILPKSLIIVIINLRNSNKKISLFIEYEDIHNSWLYCITNPLELGTRVSLSHRQPYV